jgi:hypothetical protein
MTPRNISRALLAGAAVTVFVLVACSKPLVKELKVPGTAAWTDTGLDVKASQHITVMATGEVGASKDIHTGPGGFLAKPEWTKYNVLATAPHMALIGRVGEKGEPFLVGASFSGPVPTDGRLFLGINDRDTSNNLGELRATVTVK